MKIYYLPCQYSGCYYYRGYMSAVYTNQLSSPSLFGEDVGIEDIQKKSREADVVVMQRPNIPSRYEAIKALKNAGKKVIFENDDSFDFEKAILPMLRLVNNDNNKATKAALILSDTIKKSLAICDGVIASTETLAEEYRKINPNVMVVKNCIDPLDEYACKENTTGKFRVGLIGSTAMNEDYAHIKDQIKKLDDRGDITFVVFGIKLKNGKPQQTTENDFEFWNSLKNIEWQEIVNIGDYHRTLASLALDLAIIPRLDNYFNRCKSNLKFLEMSLMSIPVLAQGFSDGTSPYQGVDEPYMTVLIGADGWHDKILEIKGDYKQYKELASKAHDYVIKNYNIENYAHVWTETIEKLIK